jgi:hypothetical protein
MLDFRAANDRAVRFAIQRGEMPNLNIIQALQRQEGYEPCFGRAVETCTQTRCRWYGSCMELARFDPPRNLHPLESFPEQSPRPAKVAGSMRLAELGSSAVLGLPQPMTGPDVSSGKHAAAIPITPAPAEDEAGVLVEACE